MQLKVNRSFQGSSSFFQGGRQSKPQTNKLPQGYERTALGLNLSHCTTLLTLFSVGCCSHEKQKKVSIETLLLGEMEEK